MWFLRRIDRLGLVGQLAVVLTGCLLTTQVACTRTTYRLRADAEAYRLIGEKAQNPDWPLEDYSINIGPESRMFDPFDPDRPPLPQDDPASHRLMQYVDCKRGYPHWYANGETSRVDGVEWMQSLPMNDEGVVVLDLDQAVHLGLVNSPQYQEAFESLYLSALDVSAERFQFDTQLFAGYGTEYFSSNEDSSGLEAGTTRLSSGKSGGGLGGTGVTLQRCFTTGAQAVVGFANEFVWNFSGDNTTAATSLLDFSLVQPLLREAGRNKVMESLTQSERTLLANVRQIERFRRGFYLQVATGRNTSDGTVSARRFTNLVPASTTAGGFISLIERQQNIRNQRANITGLRTNVLQLQKTLEESNKVLQQDQTVIPNNELQVAQAQQALYNAEFSLLISQNAYQRSLDAFKIRLGLPPHICLKIEDGLLNQFNLLDPSIVKLQEDISNLRRRIGIVNESLLAEMKEKDGTITWSDELQAKLKQIQLAGARLKEIHTSLLTSNIASTEADVARLGEAIPQRQASLRRLQSFYDVELDAAVQRQIDCQKRLPPDIDPDVLDPTRLDGLTIDLTDKLKNAITKLKAHTDRIDAVNATITQLSRGEVQDPTQLADVLKTTIIYGAPELLSDLESDMLDLSLVQARARAQAIDLISVNVNMDEALDIASRNRRDWMNNRAALVDNWRQIQFVANDLEGFMNIVVDGNIGTLGNNPVKFSSKNSSLRVGVQFDAPFTRLLERNTYRATLIQYQQARRDYYTYIDEVSDNLRNILRTMELSKLNFETRRFAVLAAIKQVVLNGEIRRIREETGGQQRSTAARDIVQALGDLQNAQDSFMGVWVDYEVLRRSLDYDLGTMELDMTGLWIDPGPMDENYGRDASDTCEEGWDTILAPNDASYLRQNPFLEEGEMSLPAEPIDTPVQSDQPDLSDQPETLPPPARGATEESPQTDTPPGTLPEPTSALPLNSPSQNRSAPDPPQFVRWKESAAEDRNPAAKPVLKSVLKQPDSPVATPSAKPTIRLKR